MPMSFPNLESLANRAKMRNFRQPTEIESESEYREAFAEFMQNVDMMEAAEIRMGSMPLDFVKEHDPLSLLAALTGRSREDMHNILKDN